MRIRIEDLPEEGQELRFDEHDSWASEALSGALDAPVTHLEGHLVVRRVRPGVMVTGSAHGEVRRPCDRCLADLRFSLGGELNLFYEAFRPTPGVEAELRPEDMDTGFFDGVYLDLSAVLAEHFAIEAPPRIRCTDPGVERMEPGTCELGGPSWDRGADDPVDPRFSALSRLHLEDEGS